MFVGSFVIGGKRARYLSLLDSERGRKKILNGFHHCRDLDSRFAQHIPNNQQSAQSIEALLKSKGAPKMCYVMSDDANLDGRRLAKESGIHPNVLSKYVNNQVREISLDTLNVMCGALKCQPGDLIEYVREKKS